MLLPIVVLIGSKLVRPHDGDVTPVDGTYNAWQLLGQKEIPLQPPKVGLRLRPLHLFLAKRARQYLNKNLEGEPNLRLRHTKTLTHAEITSSRC